MPNPKKKLPVFRTEAEERAFWERHDSCEYVDWRHARPTRLPSLKPSTKTLSLRLPVTLLEKLRLEANRRDISCQSLIRIWLSKRLDKQRR